MLIIKKHKEILLKKFEKILKIFHLSSCNNYPYKQQLILLNGNLFLVRSAEESDVKAILAVERDAFAGKVPWNRSVFLNEFRCLSPHIYLVVEKNDKIIAYSGGRIDQNDLHLTTIVVNNEYQHLGVGKFLLNEIHKFAKKKKADKITLEVNINNKHAQSFYRRFGFNSIILMKNYYRDLNEDAVKMEYIL